MTKTLQAAVKSGRMSHAYLFTGPRGVGKTSVARILAHEVNQLPYKDESVHLDIIEIDAASNRRIDEVRDLREKVRIAPASADYKVYIIDEVHMLTREAFNALLKTLEEPPAHCIFILATTEAHRLPETIISRTQRFEFKPISTGDSAKHLDEIARREKINIDREALELLAEFGQGSFRDSISYLDQLSTRSGKITADDVRTALGLPSRAEIDHLLAGIQSGSLGRTMDSLKAIRGQGVEASQAAASLAARLRELASEGKTDAAMISLLKQLLEVPGSSRPHDFLEIIVLEACQLYSQRHNPRTQDPDKAESDSPKASGGSRRKSAEPLRTPPKGGFDISRWDEVVEQVKSKAASIYTALRLAEPRLEDGKLTLKFQFPLHQKKIEQAKNKQLIASVIEELFGEKLQVSCEVDKTAFAATPGDTSEPAAGEPADLTSINNIFGGAEVLES